MVVTRKLQLVVDSSTRRFKFVKGSTVEEYKLIAQTLADLIGKKCNNISKAMKVIQHAKENVDCISFHDKTLIRIYVDRCEHLIKMINENHHICLRFGLDVNETINFLQHSKRTFKSHL